MGFASAWLDERTLFPRFIGSTPGNKTGIIIVVPAYNEPGIVTLLDSLIGCDPPVCRCEMIIVINAPAGASEDEILNNENSVAAIERWKLYNRDCFFDTHIINTGRSALKDWGVGLARKTGMDEALRRFDQLNNPDGIIVCLDADCTVDPGYFVALESDFLLKPDKFACSIAFEHELPGETAGRNSIIQYELHLRYLLQAQKYCGYSNAFHTVGSAMAVRASRYVKCGGMNRKQAGEDFYFIQKLVEMGGFFSLTSATVRPSARQSHRVPFGTGAMMRKMAEATGDILYTYNVKAYQELKLFFSMTGKFRSVRTEELAACYKDLPPGLRNFVSESDFIRKLTEIRDNTSVELTFIRRFFVWFNMFRIVRYLNHNHTGFFERQAVALAAKELLLLKGIKNPPENPEDLLVVYRDLERS